MRFNFTSLYRLFACLALAMGLGLLLTGRAIAQEEADAIAPEAAAEPPAPITLEEAQAAAKEAEEAINAGEYQKAFEAYSKLFQFGQQNAATQGGQIAMLMGHTGRGRALAGMQEYEAALEEWQQVENVSREFFPMLIARGQMYLDLGLPQQALPDFQAAVKQARQSLEAQFGLGKSLIQLGQWQQGVRALTRVIESAPDNAEAYQLRGTGQAGLFKFKEAVADLEKAISLDPENHESYFALGIVYLRMEDYAASLEQLGRAIEHYTPRRGQEDLPYVQGYLTRSAVYIEQGKKETDEAAQKAAYQGAIDEAERLLKQVDEKNPATAQIRAAALLARGTGERMLGQLGVAIRTFSDAIELSPDLSEAYYRRGICFHYIGEEKMAISDFVDASHINFTDPRPRLWEGFTYARLGDYHQAVRAYGDALAASDRYAPAYMNRGLAYMALGEYDKAITDLDDAIRLEPSNADYYFKRGVAQRLEGNLDEASRSFASAIEFNEDYAAAYERMAETLESLGHNELARQYREKARQLQPHSVE